MADMEDYLDNAVIPHSKRPILLRESTPRLVPGDRAGRGRTRVYCARRRPVANVPNEARGVNRRVFVTCDMCRRCIHPLDSISILGLIGLGILISFFSGCFPPSEGVPIALNEIRYWAYQLQGLDQPGAIDVLSDSGYDLLVLEPTNTDVESIDFNTRDMVERLHISAASRIGKTKLVIAYINIGEAEDWRTYWGEDWIAPTEESAGTPDFMIRPDPDGWSGDYPVAYWDERWKDIVLYDNDSLVQRALDDGFDGIYMDWVEAYADDGVVAAAAAAGVDPIVEMVEFIREIRATARTQNPDFLIIAQNASELATLDEDYLNVIDAIGQEAVYFDGDPDTIEEGVQGGDVRTPATGAGYSTAYFEQMLDRYRQAGKVVLTVDYAQEPDNVAEAYRRAAARGYIPYISLRLLDALTNTPPAGLGE